MIPIMEPIIDHQEIDRVMDCLKSGWISSQGKYISEFEEAFSRFCGMEYGIATSNGTTALHLALVVLGIGPGDEVIVPALSFIATANAVRYCGARPVFVDVEEKSWTMDPRGIRPLINARTKAILPVHLYGHPADMDPILEIARQHTLWVIEDAAEAHGALYKGRKVGSLADAACFSFYGNKIISTGEGGMVVTRNAEWADRARMLRDHGMSKAKKYWHPLIGYNYRMTNIQAAIGMGQMEKLEGIIEGKRRIARSYSEKLQTLKGIVLPEEAAWAKSVFWLYSIILEEADRTERDRLLAYLTGKGIECRPVFYPIPGMPPYPDEGPFPVSEGLSKRGLSLPSGTRLSEQEIAFVVDCLVQYLTKLHG